MPVYLALCLILIALNLRTVFSSLGAILDEVEQQASVGAWAIPALTTGPVTCLGIVAPLAPALLRWLGSERTLLLCSLLLTAGLLLRGTSGLPALIAGTCVCGLAIGVANVLLPVMVKTRFPLNLGLMNGLYTAAICASAALGAGFTYPLFETSGSWNWALGIWALPATAAGLVLLPLAWRCGPEKERGTRSPVTPVWRTSLAWSVSAVMALQAMMSFGVFAWLAPILRERGMDAASAGLTVSMSILLQILGSLAAPLLAVRCREQHYLIAVAAISSGSGFALSACGPEDLLWLWTAVLGLGQGSLTALALTLISLRTRDAQTASRLSGMTQCIGYGIGSSGTFIVGWTHGLTGDFTMAGLFMLGIGAMAGGAGTVAGRNRVLT
jgi:CP family cyanate transporter-like MFS transporter